MNDRPTAEELVLAVKEHLEKQVMGALGDPKLRYQTLVAAHVLSVVARELAAGERAAREELAGLHALEGKPEPAGLPLSEVEREIRSRTRALSAAIRSGDLPEPERVRAHVRRTVLAKLAVASPSYASVASPKKAGTTPTG